MAYPEEEITCYPVAPLVNSPSNKGLELIVEVSFNPTLGL